MTLDSSVKPLVSSSTALAAGVVASADRFALGDCAVLAIAILASGTVIEQGQSVEFYQANYPEHPALFGFLTWKVLLTVGWDHVYRTWWF